MHPKRHQIIEDAMRSVRNLWDAKLCKGCNGWGVRSYPNTDTWRHSMISGQAVTNDVCDQCWEVVTLMILGYRIVTRSDYRNANLCKE